MNDAPAARQSRGTARPQTGESTFPHQERVDVCIGSFFFFSPGKQKNRAGTLRADSILSLSLFVSLFLRVLPSRERRAFFFSPEENRTAAGGSTGSGEDRSALQCALKKHISFLSKLKISQDSCCVKNNLTRILLN